MVLPGIVPRVREFFGTGFGWLAFLMALTYQTVRLLPPTHPYCNSANMGRFGIRHVIAEAANNLKFDRHHIDQVVIFVAMLSGFVLLALQFAFLIVSVIVNAAYAGGPPAPFAGMFNTANPDQDIALMLMWQVFGVPGFFCSSTGTCTALENTAGGPTPYHLGLHALFEFYNMAMLLVGVLILLYYVVVIVGETAQTGTPFGRRFSHIYAPLRLVIAVGLLVPLNYGYNSAQYITMFAARMGSGFATNTWILFNTSLGGTNSTGLPDESLLARTKAPDAQHLVKFMQLVNACRYGYQLAFTPRPGMTPPEQPVTILPYFVEGDRQQAAGMTGPGLWDQGNTFYNQGDIIIRFGYQNADLHPQEAGNVKPYCGELMLPRVDQSNPMAVAVARLYAGAVSTMWTDIRFRAFGERAAHMELPYRGANPCIHEGNLNNPGCDPAPAYPNFEYKQQIITQMQTTFDGAVHAAYTGGMGAIGYALPADLVARGWGGAGIWYNRIAQWNSSWIGAVRSLPNPVKMPWPMEQVQSQRRGSVANIDRENRFNPQQGSQSMRFERDEEWFIASMLNIVYVYWDSDNANETTDVRDSHNPFINVINMIFGIEGLFAMRENHDIHPLAQLVALGKGIIDASVRNLTISIGFSAATGGLEGIQWTVAAGVTQGLASMFMSFTLIGLTIGFILFYILPFMPFMYFFFAVGGWVKSVFEAMVGVPLWALAHLKIDGNGLPGDAAMNGYFLIFEIFVRPVLTVFGLLAGLIIFTAQVRVLHEIFPLVTQNMTGFDPDVNNTTVPGLLYTGLLENAGFEFKRDPIDEFFFTIIYTIIVYLLATSSFKLIDQIPNSILRWMGTGAQAFADRREDPAQNLTTYAAIGGAQIGSQVTGILSQGAQGVGKAVGSTGKSLFDTLSGRIGSRATGTPD